MMKSEIWYEISAREIARDHTLAELHLTNEPKEGEEIFKEYQGLLENNLVKARGFKYGVSSYSEMYQKEREAILGNWQDFFLGLCRLEGVGLSGKIMVLGINDGQEVGFIESEDILGVDISQGAIARGKRLYDHINFMQGELTRFLVKDKTIETCIFLRTIHIFGEKDIEKILCHISSFLRDGGKTIISIPGGFLTKSNEIVLGQRMNDSLVDKDKPARDALQIYLKMKEVGFVDLNIINREIEIFIVGTKA